MRIDLSGASEHMDFDDEDESVEPAGKFRVYLGAVAGVGKTWAM